MKKLSSIIFLIAFIQANVFAQSCLPEGITFTTQEQIDNFQTNYQNCTEIEGNVIINGSDIINLEGLSVLTSIGGYLKIHANGALTSLTGFGNVMSIGEYLKIHYNTALTSLAGLENLTTIGGCLWIDNNAALTSLSEFENVTSIGEYINIFNNDALTSLAGFENVTSIEGNLSIKYNAALASLTGLDNVTSIEGYLEIWGNNALTSLTGLDNMASIGEYLAIDENPALISLTGLDNLTDIGEGLGISWNNALSSLTALHNLTSIGGYLSITFNQTLTSLSGLDNIDTASVNILYIHVNISLTTCEVKSICDYLAGPNAYVYIYDNASGCNSQEEVVAACDEAGTSDINFETIFSIYPNPAYKELIIRSNTGIIINEVSIYSRIGQKVLSEKRITNPIDISMLPPGLYIIELVTNDIKIRKKLIII